MRADAGMARFRRIERRVIRRASSRWWRFWWRLGCWLFGAAALVAVCAAVMCRAAALTERLPGGLGVSPEQRAVAAELGWPLQ